VMAKLDTEVRKALGLTSGAPAAGAAPTNGAAAGRVTTMPAATETPKAPIVAARR
jgi:hypothetical protein